ncbi:MAG: hypothetical protein ACD_74C00161G0001 [uncultured bacterium]|nr:MAG: hypothetical protein ACD_74C00161G0001 [uncultured bacterium]
MAVNGEVELVLDLGEEGLGGRGVLVIVHAGGVDVGDLLIKAPLAEADFPNLFQQALEIILAQKRAVLHALLVQHIALDGKLAQHPGGPLAELGSSHRIDPVADGDDGVEVVEIDVSGDPPVSLGLNYPEFPDSCLPLDFPGIADVLQVLADSANIHIKQLSHEFLGQPDGLVLITGLDALFPRLAGEDQEFGGGIADQFLVVVGHVILPIIQRPDNQSGRAAKDFPWRVLHFHGPDGLQQSGLPSR